jgi:ABC-2 type transport system permease protein
VNWQHFRTLIWLRGRLFRNRMRRAGKFNAVVTQILKVLALIGSVGLFFAALGLGVWLLPKAPSDRVPEVMLYLWTGVTVGFLFFWMMGVMTELQRSEVLSIEKLFHFPISPSSAFLINYLSSLVSLSLILFFPAMLGLAIASVIALGPWMLVSLPLLIAFLLMVTAITYQFRGWLATLMVNKRRRRTIVACVTGFIILMSQLPNLINLTYQSSRNRNEGDRNAEVAEVNDSLQAEQRAIKQLQIDLDSKKITPQQSQQRLAAILEAQKINTEAVAEMRRQRDNHKIEITLKAVKRWVAIADLALPPGWLAYGVYGAAEHQIWPALAGTLLLCVLAGASLRRSYRTTVRFYLGGFRSDQSTMDAARAAAVPVAPRHLDGQVAPPATGMRAAHPPLAGMVGKSLPWVPEQAAATGLATLRSLLRAPEVKMMLLTPLILGGVIMASRLAGRGGTPVPPAFRSMIALGIVVTVVVSLSQLFQNQFGFDRSAFRIFVLSPAPRRQILLGKNLALAPIVAAAGVIFLGILEFMFPLRLTDLLATFVELLTAYLIVCLVGNQMSILLPSAIRQGSMRSSETKVVRVLARFLAMLGMLVAFVPLVIPLGAGYLVEQVFPWAEWIPVYLILSLLVALITLFVYRMVLDYQGGLLQQRELRILEAVTTKDD